PRRRRSARVPDRARPPMRRVRGRGAGSATAARSRVRGLPPRGRRPGRRQETRPAAPRPRPRRRRTRRRSSGQHPERAQLPDRLEEGAAADRVEKQTPRVGERLRSGLAPVPAKRALVELEGAGRGAERLLLVAEDGGREEVEEAVL